MKLVSQIFIIFGIIAGSEFIVNLLQISIPSNILGMLILLALLIFKVIKPQQIMEFSMFLFKNMALFIIPAALSIMSNFDLIKGSFIPFFLITIFSTALVFGFTGKAVSLFQKPQAPAEEEETK